MLFQKDHIKLIKRGEKVVTRRRWKRWHAKVNGVYPCQVKMYQSKKECPLIKCIKRYEQKLGDMTEDDALKEGGYTLKEYKELWRDINGVPFDEEEVVKVVEFEYVEEEQTQ